MSSVDTLRPAESLSQKGKNMIKRGKAVLSRVESHRPDMAASIKGYLLKVIFLHIRRFINDARRRNWI